MADPAVGERFFEDLAIGQTLRLDTTVVVTAEGIKAFAREFDPQPFHLDEGAARRTPFAGLVASGWHTAAMTMRLTVEGDLRLAGGTVGVGVEELRWPKPVRPGDELRVEIEILELRASRTRPELGVVKIRLTTFNQRGETVQIGMPTLMVPRRPG